MCSTISDYFSCLEYFLSRTVPNHEENISFGKVVEKDQYQYFSWGSTNQNDPVEERKSIDFKWIEKRSSHIESFRMKSSKKTVWNWNTNHCDFVWLEYQRNLSNIIENDKPLKIKRSQWRNISFMFCLTSRTSAVWSFHNEYINMIEC